MVHLYIFFSRSFYILLLLFNLVSPHLYNFVTVSLNVPFVSRCLIGSHPISFCFRISLFTLYVQFLFLLASFCVPVCQFLSHPALSSLPHSLLVHFLPYFLVSIFLMSHLLFSFSLIQNRNVSTCISFFLSGVSTLSSCSVFRTFFDSILLLHTSFAFLTFVPPLFYSFSSDLFKFNHSLTCGFQKDLQRTISFPTNPTVNKKTHHHYHLRHRFRSGHPLLLPPPPEKTNMEHDHLNFI